MPWSVLEESLESRRNGVPLDSNSGFTRLCGGDLAAELQKAYDSEINVRIGRLWLKVLFQTGAPSSSEESPRSSIQAPGFALLDWIAAQAAHAISASAPVNAISRPDFRTTRNSLGDEGFRTSNAFCSATNSVAKSTVDLGRYSIFSTSSVSIESLSVNRKEGIVLFSLGTLVPWITAPLLLHHFRR